MKNIKYLKRIFKRKTEKNATGLKNNNIMKKYIKKCKIERKSLSVWTRYRIQKKYINLDDQLQLLIKNISKEIIQIMATGLDKLNDKIFIPSTNIYNYTYNIAKGLQKYHSDQDNNKKESCDCVQKYIFLGFIFLRRYFLIQTKKNIPIPQESIYHIITTAILIAIKFIAASDCIMGMEEYASLTTIQLDQLYTNESNFYDIVFIGKDYFPLTLIVSEFNEIIDNNDSSTNYTSI